MNMHPKLQKIQQLVSYHGLGKTAFNLGYRVANRFMTAMVLKVVVLTMDGVNKGLIAGLDDRWKFLTREELEHFSKVDSSLDLDPDFLAHALARGDRCYGFVQDGVLGAYGWYSNHPTPASANLTVEFDPDYVYMYAGFTADAFRGMRLHGIGMARAMQAFTEQGSKGLISYVEAHNQASLKSCKRLGYRTIGTVIIASVGRACVSYPSPGCKPFGFRVAVGRSSWLQPETLAARA
jgi:hypothetical protein